MGCGEKWKVGDKIMASSQVPQTVEAIDYDGTPLLVADDIDKCVRAWHPHCLE